MVSIQIKHVPDETHAVLRRRAAAARMSLQQYLLTRLVEEAQTPTNAEIFEEIEEELQREGGGGPEITLEEIVRSIHDAREGL